MRQRIKNLLGNKTLLFISILYSCIITVLFLVPTGDFPKVRFTGADKVMHILINIILILSWQLYFYVKNGNRIKNGKVVAIFAIIVLYGIIIELCQQMFTPSREADWQDLLANFTGLLLGIFLFKRCKGIINF